MCISLAREIIKGETIKKKTSYWLLEAKCFLGLFVVVFVVVFFRTNYIVRFHRLLHMTMAFNIAFVNDHA